VSGDGQVRLAWPRVADASSYTVKRATATGGPYATIASGLSAPAFTDTGLVNGTTCHYVVSAANAFADGPSSAPASTTPRLTRTTPPEISAH
jgi:cellulose 1,4-beta-cellobiosidase